MTYYHWINGEYKSVDPSLLDLANKFSRRIAERAQRTDPQIRDDIDVILHCYDQGCMDTEMLVYFLLSIGEAEPPESLDQRTLHALDMEDHIERRLYKDALRKSRRRCSRR